MSLKRKFHELRRLFRHQTIQFIAFALVILCVERAGEHISHVRGGRSNFNAIPDNGELPGSEDPETVLKDSLGNFEPAEEIDAGTPGELGKPVHIDSSLPDVKRAFSDFGFNTYVSDMISMNRSLPDM
uniref:Uncharacterized protein n=1 Tax=Panagrolaimus davidi TaxID=227884 RepID=A0A914PT60_9BILA